VTTIAPFPFTPGDEISARDEKIYVSGSGSKRLPAEMGEVQAAFTLARADTRAAAADEGVDGPLRLGAPERIGRDRQFAHAAELDPSSSVHVDPSEVPGQARGVPATSRTAHAIPEG
jgi:hypothetical protein